MSRESREITGGHARGLERVDDQREGAERRSRSDEKGAGDGAFVPDAPRGELTGSASRLAVEAASNQANEWSSRHTGSYGQETLHFYSLGYCYGTNHYGYCIRHG